MIDNLPEINFKLEHMDPDILECINQSYLSGNNLNLSQLNNSHRPSIDTNKQQSNAPKQSNMTIAQLEKENTNTWLDELSDYSSNIARQTQTTLRRIKNDFMKIGLTFDDDFRNHFLYLATNRITESFDAFLIGLPKQMKTSDCFINKPKVIPKPIEESEPVEPPAKRIRADDNLLTESSTIRVAKAHATQMNQTISVTSSLRKPARIENSTKVTQVASQSNKATQITSQFNKNTEVTLLSARSGNFKNASKITPEVSVKKVISNVTEASTKMIVKNGEKIVIPKEKIVLNCRIGEHPRQNNIPSRTKDKIALPKNRGGLDNTIDALRNRIASAENRVVQRRKSMGMVSIPITNLYINPQPTGTTKSIETVNRQQHIKPLEMPKSNQNEKIAAKPILMRRKTFVDKDLLSNKTRNEITITSRVKVPEPQPQPNVTLPVAEGIVTRSQIQTRSRRSAGNLARTVNIFSCDTCPYTSEVRTNWQRHMLIHSGIKPFQCKHCSKGFTQKVNLKSHMKSNHYDLHGNPDYWL